MKRRKLTKAREQVGDLMLQTLIVEAHCKKLYGGEHWPHEQFLFVWELVRDWAEDRYGAAALTWWTICKIAEFTSKNLATSRTATCKSSLARGENGYSRWPCPDHWRRSFSLQRPDLSAAYRAQGLFVSGFN